MLPRFAKKSPTSSPEVDIDVGRPNIDVVHCCKKIGYLRNYLRYRNGKPLFRKFEAKKKKSNSSEAKKVYNVLLSFKSGSHIRNKMLSSKHF